MPRLRIYLDTSAINFQRLCMTRSELVISKRLQEVWDWKEAIYKEVAHLPTHEALREIHRKARLVAEQSDLPRERLSRRLPVSASK